MQRLVDTLIEDPTWEQAALPDLAEAAAAQTLRHLGLDPAQFTISLMGCDDARIATLNTEFRDKPRPTNVLSWPSDERGADVPGGRPAPPQPDPFEPRTELGDIAIAHGVCLREAEAAARPFDDHVTHLLVHGVLHLLGYDHIADEDAALMEGLETEILAALHVADPYSD